MSLTFTKLFSSITESTVWCEPAGTRLTWITMLAMADRHGRVFASIPGLANRARVSLEECEHALATFNGPDKYSRTPDNDGRRIEPIDGGWRLLNHQKYRDMRDEESRTEQNREAKRRQRAKEQEVSKDADSQPGSANWSAQAEAEADTDSTTSTAPNTHAPSQDPVRQRTEAGRACVLMRKAGCHTTNPSHPNLLAALADGVTPEALGDCAALAVQAGKSNPFAYAIAAARSQRAEGITSPTTGARHEAPRRMSAVDRVRDSIRRARIDRGESPDD